MRDRHCSVRYFCENRQLVGLCLTVCSKDPLNISESDKRQEEETQKKREKCEYNLQTQKNMMLLGLFMKQICRILFLSEIQ
jgi:hypothetical protein